MIEKLKERGIFSMLHGISMNTGGGATKIGHVGQGIVYLKEMPEPPAIFRLIKEESGETWRNMHRTFNCGVGLDIVGQDDPAFESVLKLVGELTGIEMFELGVCRKNRGKKNRVVLQTGFGKFDDY